MILLGERLIRWTIGTDRCGERERERETEGSAEREIAFLLHEPLLTPQNVCVWVIQRVSHVQNTENLQNASS